MIRNEIISKRRASVSKLKQILPFICVPLHRIGYISNRRTIDNTKTSGGFCFRFVSEALPRLLEPF